MRYIKEIDSRIHFPSSTQMERHVKFPSMVHILGEFNEENIKKFREDFMNAEQDAIESGQKVLPIVIDSYGGIIDSMFSAVELIRNSKVKVATICEGKAMSAGAALLTFGASGQRYIGPNSRVMIHDVQAGSIGKTEEMISTSNEVKRMQDKIYEMMAENCGHDDPKYFERLMKENDRADLYLTPDQAVEYNICNKIKIPTLKTKVEMKVEFG